MRIALVIGSYNAQGGGAERWTDRHARRLLADGHEVHLVAKRFLDAPPDGICRFVQTDRWALRPRLAFAEAAERLLSQDRFDCIHDMGDGWYCDVFMPHHGTRRAGFEQNSRFTPPALRWTRSWARRLLPRYREFEALERLQYRQSGVKVFIALSQMVRRHMMEYCRVSESAIRVIYNGVDISRFSPCRDISRRKKLRSDFGFDAETVFLIVAHNFKLKGLAVAINALARLSVVSTKIGLLVVGGDDPRPYEKQARRLGCESSIRFAGNQADPRICYHAADVYLHPTYYDPCSLVVLEAFACGLPVITTRHNGAGELMTHGLDGCLLDDSDDAVGLADAMSRFLDPVARRRAGVSVRRIAEKRSAEHNTAELVRLYHEVAALRSRYLSREHYGPQGSSRLSA